MKTVLFVGCDTDINYVSAFLDLFERRHFDLAIAPCALRARPAPVPARTVLCALAPFVVKALLVCALSPDVLDHNAPTLPDNVVGLCLEHHHVRQIGVDSVGGVHFCVYNTVKGPAQLLDSAQAGQ